MHAVLNEGAAIDESGALVRTEFEAGRRLPAINIPATAEHVIPAREIPLFNPTIDSATQEGFFVFSPDGQSYRRTGRLPEGRSLRLCIRLHDYNNSAIVRGRYECSDPFQIAFPSPPELRFPIEASVTDAMPLFQWDHTIPVALSPGVRYTIQIKEVPEGRNANPELFLLFDGTRDVQAENITGRSWQLTSLLSRMQAGRVYAWRERATTPTVIPPVRFMNEGWSEIWTFHYVSEAGPRAPRLLMPEDGARIGRPIALDWTDVTLPDGSPAHYRVSIASVSATGEVDPNAARAATLPRLTVTESRVSIPSGVLQPEIGRRYAWIVQAVPRTGVAYSGPEFENGGYSRQWTFTVTDGSGEGGEEEGGDDLLVMLHYPAQGQRIPDAQPPFVAQPMIDRATVQRLRLTITETARAGGAARGVVFDDSTANTLPASGSLVLLNRYGTGGSTPAGMPLFARGWTPEPGSSYRWSVAVQTASRRYRNSTTFIAAPRAHNMEPRDGRSVVGASQRLSYAVERPTISAAGAGVAPGFAPGDLPAAGNARYVMNAVIRRDIAADTMILYQTHTALDFRTGTTFNFDEALPDLRDGAYRWVVNTKFEGRIVASSEEQRFTLGDGSACTDACLCVDAVYPTSGGVPPGGGWRAIKSAGVPHQRGCTL